jgi:hypothetical protein
MLRIRKVLVTALDEVGEQAPAIQAQIKRLGEALAE